MPNKYTTDNNYRYAFQGQEKDGETGMEAFELRLWDGRLGRWLTTDPKRVGHSPYWGMNNNPMRIIDPDGGQGEDWIKNKKTGEYVWDNSVTSASNTPEGFAYIGKNDVDIIYDLFGIGNLTGLTDFSCSDWDFGIIDIQDFDNPYSAKGAAPLSLKANTKMNIHLSANVKTTYSGQNLNKKFNGVDINVSVSGNVTAPYPDMNIKLLGRSMTVNGSEMSVAKPSSNPEFSQGGDVPTLKYYSFMSSNTIMKNFGKEFNLNFGFYGQYVNGLNSLRLPTVLGGLGIENSTYLNKTIKFHNLIYIPLKP